MRWDIDSFQAEDYPFELPKSHDAASRIEADPRFTMLLPQGSGPTLYATKRSAIGGLFRASLSLSQTESQSLSTDCLFEAMGWESPANRQEVTRRLITWGERWGLIAKSTPEGLFSLPLASFLRDLSSGTKARPTRQSLADSLVHAKAIIESTEDSASLGRIEDAIKSRIHSMDYRRVRVFQSRTGLDGGAPMTLDEVGRRLRISRERVRQLESKVYERLSRYTEHWILTAILEFLENRGHRATSLSDDRLVGRRLICELLGLQSAEVPEADLVIFALPPKQLGALNWNEWGYRELFGGSGIARIIRWRGGLTWEDVCLLRDRLRILRKSGLSELDRITCAMHRLGRPGHYSEIAAVYNELFPDSPQSDRNVHGGLSRMRKTVAYTGIKGTYGLISQGAIRPEEQIWDLVPMVHARVYALIGAALPFNVILSEVRKVRPNADETSVRMILLQTATRTEGDRWLPREHDKAGEGKAVRMSSKVL